MMLVDPRQIPAITATLEMIQCLRFCRAGCWVLLWVALLSADSYVNSNNWIYTNSEINFFSTFT